MNESTSTQERTSHGKRRIIIGVSALLVAVLAAGGAVAVYRHSASAQLAEAREACARSSETLRVARNTYDTLHDQDAAEAVKITDKQVADGDTVTVLAAAYKEKTPDLAACNVSGVDQLREVMGRIEQNAAWYDTHTADLSKAVDAVNESHVYFVKLGCTASSLFLDGVGACFGRCRRFGVPSVLLVWLFHE